MAECRRRARCVWRWPEHAGHGDRPRAIHVLRTRAVPCGRPVRRWQAPVQAGVPAAARGGRDPHQAHWANPCRTRGTPGWQADPGAATTPAGLAGEAGSERGRTHAPGTCLLPFAVDRRLRTGTYLAVGTRGPRLARRDEWSVPVLVSERDWRGPLYLA